MGTTEAIGACQHCHRPLPAAAVTGRTRLYCTPACRKAAYEARRARRPDATRVNVVERIVDEGHGIEGCVARVTDSPRACTNVVKHLTALIRTGQLTSDPKWQPVARAINDLNRELMGWSRRRAR